MDLQKTIAADQPVPGENPVNTIYFSPSSILAVFNASIVTKEERKIIQVRGIFKKSGTANYGGFYYDTLKDEASDNFITLLTSELLHNQLDDNKTIEFNGFITRKLDKGGRISIHINLMELLDQRMNKFSDEETKKILLINKKVTEGFKDLDAHIKNCIFNNKRVSIKVVMGKSGIIDTDIKKGMEAAISLYDIEYHRISLSGPDEIISKIKSLDTSTNDVICVARGGGENLDIFENLGICESILGRKTIIASAIGHADNVTLFEKISDKKFITPTQFGNYLKEIYNSTTEEFQRSKAKMVQDTKNELKIIFDKQMQNLNDQLKAAKELNEKTLAATKKNHDDQVLFLSNKLKSLEDLGGKTSQEKAVLHLTEVTNLRKQIQDLTAQYQTQLLQTNKLRDERLKAFGEQIQNLKNQQFQKDSLIEKSNALAANFQRQMEDAQSTAAYFKKQLREAKSKSGIIIIAIIIALIVGIVIGVVLFGKH